MMPTMWGDFAVAYDRLPARLALAAVLAAALGLAACGRKGPLDLPPEAALGQQSPAPPVVPGPGEAPVVSQQSGFDAQGNPIAPPGPRRGFILDPLLD
jgi:predicted small lipoprotein YifL